MTAIILGSALALSGCDTVDGWAGPEMEQGADDLFDSGNPSPDESVTIDSGSDDIHLADPKPADPGPPTEPCNGHLSLCDRRFDEVAYVTTHNAMSNKADGFAAPNQYNDIPTQLADGVRGLMLDTHYYEGEAYLCHGDCIYGRRPLVDGLGQIRSFLEAHPREVVTIIFEAYVSAADTEKAFMEAGLSGYLHSQVAGDPWPTLAGMIEGGRRLVVFTDRYGGKPSWYHRVWDYCWETDWSVKDIGMFDCEPNRGDPDNPLFILNHFVTDPLPFPSVAEEVNSNPAFLELADECRKETGSMPNFVTVDYYSLGDVFEVVDALNGVTGGQP